MRDWWYAECIPCGWQQRFTSQDSAIGAAEEHVFDKHRRVPNYERGEKKIGHVQNRTESVVSNERAPSLEAPPLTLEAAAVEPSVEPAPEMRPPKQE
jgi:hypothetical protein